MPNEATPGVKFTAGQSHQQIREMLGDLTGVRDMLKDIATQGKAASAAVAGLKAPGAARRPAAPKSPLDQEYERVTAARRAATRAEIVARAHDPLEQEYAAKQAATRTQRMQAAVAPKDDLQRRYEDIQARDRRKMMEESVKRGTTNPEGSALGRLTNFAGWSPFMPGGNMLYMLQMALGPMGAGLSLPFVAAGMGAASLGALGLSANAFAVQAQRTGQQTIAATGAPPFSPDTFVTGATEAQLLEQRAGQLHLTGPQTQQAVSALAAGGLDAQKAFGDGLTQTATLVNAFGMSVSDAANFVTTMRVQMGRSTDETAASIAAFGKIAQATGQPLAALGQIVEQTPNMLANLSGQDLAVAASVARAMGGSTQGGIALQSVANASGAQALSIAAQMGLTDQQFNALQGTAGGNKRIDDFVVGVVQRSMAQSGGATDQAMIVANALLGTNFDKATFTRLNGLGAGFSTDAFNKAMNAPLPPPTPGNLNSAVANGLPGVNDVANPWNVKDMAVNAANVVITGALGNAGTAAALIANPGQFSAADRGEISGQGGLAGFVANVGLAGQGNAPAAGRAYEQIIAAVLPSVLGLIAGPGGAAAGRSVAANMPTPGGGGGGGANLGTFTLRVDTGGRVTSIPVAIQNGRPSQQFTQYVRGPQ